MNRKDAQPRGSAAWLAAVAAAALIAACLARCSGAGGGQGASALKQESYPFVMLGDDDDPGDKQVSLCFVGGGDVPYVALSEFLPLLGDMYKEDSSGIPAARFDAALGTFISIYIDDLHSAFQSPSYLSGAAASDSDGGEANAPDQIDIKSLLVGEPLTMGESSLGTSRDLIAYRTYRAMAYPDLEEARDGGMVLYEEVGDTAIITFDEFTALKDDYYKDADLDNPQDTIELIASTHKNITREGSPVRNVVIDLSNNGGGQIDTAAFLIAWCKGPTPLAVRNVLTGAQTVASYRADVNLDGAFDKNDVLPASIKVYCLTSPYSFSCGNLVPSVFKGSPRISLIGRASGGGTCAVLPCSTASGPPYRLARKGGLMTTVLSQ